MSINRQRSESLVGGPSALLAPDDILAASQMTSRRSSTVNARYEEMLMRFRRSASVALMLSRLTEAEVATLMDEHVQALTVQELSIVSTAIEERGGTTSMEMNDALLMVSKIISQLPSVTSKMPASGELRLVAALVGIREDTLVTQQHVLLMVDVFKRLQTIRENYSARKRKAAGLPLKENEQEHVAMSLSSLVADVMTQSHGDSTTAPLKMLMQVSGAYELNPESVVQEAIQFSPTKQSQRRSLIPPIDEGIVEPSEAQPNAAVLLSSPTSDDDTQPTITVDGISSVFRPIDHGMLRLFRNWGAKDPNQIGTLDADTVHESNTPMSPGLRSSGFSSAMTHSGGTTTTSASVAANLGDPDDIDTSLLDVDDLQLKVYELRDRLLANKLLYSNAELAKLQVNAMRKDEPSSEQFTDPLRSATAIAARFHRVLVRAVEMGARESGAWPDVMEGESVKRGERQALRKAATQRVNVIAERGHVNFQEFSAIMSHLDAPKLLLMPTLAAAAMNEGESRGNGGHAVGFQDDDDPMNETNQNGDVGDVSVISPPALRRMGTGSPGQLRSQSFSNLKPLPAGEKSQMLEQATESVASRRSRIFSTFSSDSDMDSPRRREPLTIAQLLARSGFQSSQMAHSSDWTASSPNSRRLRPDSAESASSPMVAGSPEPGEVYQILGTTLENMKIPTATALVTASDSNPPPHGVPTRPSTGRVQRYGHVPIRVYDDRFTSHLYHTEFQVRSGMSPGPPPAISRSPLPSAAPLIHGAPQGGLLAIEDLSMPRTVGAGSQLSSAKPSPQKQSDPTSSKPRSIVSLIPPAMQELDEVKDATGVRDSGEEPLGEIPRLKDSRPGTGHESSSRGRRTSAVTISDPPSPVRTSAVPPGRRSSQSPNTPQLPPTYHPGTDAGSPDWSIQNTTTAEAAATKRSGGAVSPSPKRPFSSGTSRGSPSGQPPRSTTDRQLLRLSTINSLGTSSLPRVPEDRMLSVSPNSQLVPKVSINHRHVTSSHAMRTSTAAPNGLMNLRDSSSTGKTNSKSPARNSAMVIPDSVRRAIGGVTGEVEDPMLARAKRGTNGAKKPRVYQFSKMDAPKSDKRVFRSGGAAGRSSTEIRSPAEESLEPSLPERSVMRGGGGGPVMYVPISPRELQRRESQAVASSPRAPARPPTHDSPRHRSSRSGSAHSNQQRGGSASARGVRSYSHTGGGAMSAAYPLKQPKKPTSSPSPSNLPHHSAVMDFSRMEFEVMRYKGYESGRGRIQDDNEEGVVETAQ